MRFNSLAHSLLVFLNFIYSGFHWAQAQSPNSLPLITVELLNNQDRVFKYLPPSPGKPYGRLNVDSPLRFSNESIIFWESKDYNNRSGSGTEIKLRLKCEAPYLTKWTITTHSKAKAEETKPFYYMNYSVKQLSRDQENPLLFPQPNCKDGEFMYSLTELTVDGFGPEFKGGFINCVDQSDESLKSELYIFQRFGANARLKSVDQISRNVTDLTHIPCIVYDPDVTIKYQQVVSKKYNEYKFFEASFTTYTWRLGYRITRGGGRDYKVGAKARCVLDNGRHVYYEFIERREGGNSSNTTITIAQSLDLKGQITPSAFVCAVDDSASAPETAFQLDPCLSPDYCFSSPQTNIRNIETNKTGDGDIQIQGRVTCSPDNQSTQKQDHYFRGLSGQVYLLSQMQLVPKEEVLTIKILEEPIIETVTISCSTIKFLTYDPIKFSLIYVNGSKQLLQDAFRETLVEGILDPGTQTTNGKQGQTQIKTKTVKLKISENNYRQIRGIGCHVPWYNSTDWREIYHWTSGYKRVRDATFKEIEIVQARSENQSFANDEWKFRCEVGNLNLSEDVGALRFIELVSCVSPRDCDANQEIRAILPNTKNICSNVNQELCEISLPSPVTQPGKNIDIQGGISCLVEVKKNLIRTLPEYYFTGLSGSVYLLSQLPQEEEILNMEIKYEQFEYTSHLSVVCTTINFLTLRDIRLYVKYINHKPTVLTDNDNFESVRSNSRFIRTMDAGRNFHGKTINVPIFGADEIELTCAVPWFNSTKDNEHFLEVSNNVTVTAENTSGFPIPQNWQENWDGHTGDLNLIYYHDQVAFYSDKHLNCTSKQHFNIVSQAWTYAKETYGPLSDDPILNVVLHTDTPDQCVSSNMKSYVDDEFQNVIVIDCAKLSGGWATPADMNIVVHEIGQMVLKLAKQRGSWPAFDISQWHMSDIVAYDILLGIGNSDEASLLLERKTFNPFKASEGNTVWFSKWYYRIYMEYGNTTALDGFMSILQENWPTKENGHDYAQQLNFGQFVHFWSGAAGVNLKDLAGKAFDWRSDFEQQFQKAVETYPQIVYKGGINLDGKLQLQQIIFIAMPVVFVCILITMIVVFVVIHRKNVQRLRENMRELTNEEIQKFFDGNSKNNPADSGYAFIESQPFNKEYEIERDRLDIFHDRILGSGAFGLVLSGKIKGVPGPGNESADDVVVAVKTVKPNVEVSFFIALLTELKVMCYVGKHPNVASLLGASTTRIKNREVYVALEFCSKGDLLAFVKKYRSDFKDLISRKSENTDAAEVNETAPATDQSLTQTTSFSVVDAEPTTSHQSDSFSTLDLIEWSRQISLGMEFISSKNVIHGDLAARNVLLTENNVAKISDFGLSRQLHNYSVYMKKSKTPLPWRWMAIESLSDMNFSVQSDVWSFGVTLFEIFSLGTTPYPGCNWTHEFVDDLVGGFRLKSPQFGNYEIHDLMMNCMRHEPNERISFLDIVHKLQEIKRKLESELTMDSPRNKNYIVPS